MIDKTKSIEEIENDFWGTPPSDASGLVKSLHEIRKRKIADLDENDVRIALGQNMSLKVCVPLALDFLEDEPLIEALYYEGDLLKNLLTVDSTFWENEKELKKRASMVAKRGRTDLADLDTTEEIREELLEVTESWV